MVNLVGRAQHVNRDYGHGHVFLMGTPSLKIVNFLPSGLRSANIAVANNKRAEADAMEKTPKEQRLCAFIAEHSPKYNGGSNAARQLIRYGLATALTGAAAAIVHAESFLIPILTYSPLYLSMMLSARLFGKGQAWLSAVLAMLVIMWWSPPGGSFEVSEPIRVIGNGIALACVLLLWPASGFGDCSYRLSAIHRRIMASSNAQNSSSFSVIGRPSADSRSAITS